MLPRSVDRVTLLAFAVAVLVLGANWVAVRFSNRELAPFWGASVRFIAVTILLFAVVAIRGIMVPRGRALLGTVVYGIGQYFLTFALIYWALVVVPAGMTSVIFAVLPLMTLFVSAAVGFERVRRMNVLGALVAVAGLAIIFRDQLTGDIAFVRVAAILLSALTAAGTTVVVKAFPRTHPVATNAVGTAVGLPLLLATSAVTGEPWVLPGLSATWIALAYLAISTCVGFVLVTYVVLRWTPSAAGYSAVLGPIVTVTLATLLAGEVFGPTFFLGAAIVGIGVYLGALASTRPAAPPAPAATAAD